MFPITRDVAAEIISLPMFPTLTAEQKQRVAKEITRFLEGNVKPEIAVVPGMRR